MVVDLFAAHRFVSKQNLKACYTSISEINESWSGSRLLGWTLPSCLGGCTGVVQVMDVFINAVFKNKVRRQYLAWKAMEIRVFFFHFDGPLPHGSLLLRLAT